MCPLREAGQVSSSAIPALQEGRTGVGGGSGLSPGPGLSGDWGALLTMAASSTSTTRTQGNCVRHPSHHPATAGPWHVGTCPASTAWVSSQPRGSPSQRDWERTHHKALRVASVQKSHWWPTEGRYVSRSGWMGTAFEQVEKTNKQTQTSPL